MVAIKIECKQRQKKNNFEMETKDSIFNFSAYLSLSPSLSHDKLG